MSRSNYIIIALIAGGLGMHNFIAKRFIIGIIQLIISVSGIVHYLAYLGVLPCPITTLIVGPWVLLEIFMVKRDGNGVPFSEDGSGNDFFSIAPANDKTSGLAKVAFYVGLLSIIPAVHVIAIVLGILAVVSINRNGNKQVGKFRAIFAIVIGGIFTLFYGFILAASVLHAH